MENAVDGLGHYCCSRMRDGNQGTSRRKERVGERSKRPETIIDGYLWYSGGDRINDGFGTTMRFRQCQRRFRLGLGD